MSFIVVVTWYVPSIVKWCLISKMEWLASGHDSRGMTFDHIRPWVVYTKERDTASEVKPLGGAREQWVTIIGLGRPGSRFQTSDLSKLLRDTTESAKNLPEVKRGQRSTKKGDKCTKIRRKKVKSHHYFETRSRSNGVKRGHVRTVSRSVLELKFPKFYDVTTRI